MSDPPRSSEFPVTRWTLVIEAQGGDTPGSQEALATLGFASKDANGLIGPEILDQPLGLRTFSGELAGPLKGKGVHDFVEGLGSMAKTSKKSFSSICSRSW